MGVRPSVLVRAVLPALLAALALAAFGDRCAAAPSDAERAARWADLRHAIFGDRVVEEGNGLVAIEAPVRAEDAAIVPVAITVGGALAQQVRGLYLVIDDNPSPLAAHFLLGPLADARRIETRVRIDDYTNLHAVAETADGRLYAASRFIKAAGGCSAPAGKDQALALERLGKMKLTLTEPRRSDSPVEAKLLISHPNNSGMQIDPMTHLYIPADFMQTLEVTYDGQLVFKLESDISISEDPAINFIFRPPNGGAGELTAQILDSSQRRFSRSWPVPAPAQM
jgi:sulfur-oxidizing protein SoxY